MTEISYKGKVFDFYSLLDNCKLEIPIIQRDYAQGRVDKKEIRQNFLTAIYDSLVSNKQTKLDFIYGSKINDAFLPLDGQQRLTTLFLLHWYVATRESVINAEIRKKLAKFSYETRFSSRDFCQALVNNLISINSKEQVISENIIDSNWFFLSWKKDPTIDSMLRTIDDIHEKFYESENLWQKLTADNALISFYYVELENIGLTDDLYIKMNARGKLLTPFENFKAGFQKYVEENGWEYSVPFPETFACKIDTAFTDFFWTQFRKNNTVDESLMRLIAAIAMISQSHERLGNSQEDRIPILSSLQDQPNGVKAEHFSEAGFQYLMNCFELYIKLEADNIDINLPFPLWRHSPKKSLLSSIVFEDNVQVSGASYSQKVFFFAQTEYLKRSSQFNLERFHDWMRVVRNILSRGDIDKDGIRPDIVRSPQTFDGAINLVSELSEHCEDIYTFLASTSPIRSQFAKEQVEEERLKSRLILTDPAVKELLFETEDNELLRGRINFVLYCIDYDGSGTINKHLLQDVSTVFAKYFHREEDLSNDLRRAMLTIEVNGEYEFYNYWWSLWNVTTSTKRRLFDKFRELEYYMYSEFREYFKKLIHLLVKMDFDGIVANFVPPTTMPNWKRRLIKESFLLDQEGRSHYIAIPNDNSCCYLLKSKRPRDIDGAFKVD